MANEIARGLQALGVAGELAVEIQKQIASGTGAYKRLQELGLPPLLAKSLADMIDAGVVNADLLARHGMVPNVAAFLDKKVGLPPVVSQNPSITGDAEVGKTLVADGGTVSGPGTITSTIVWYADSVALPAQTPANELELTLGHDGSMITVGYTYCNEWGCAAEALSDPVGPVVE